MGTKNQPGAFDCYSAAEPDEPHFTLLGRDPTAPLVVYFWRALYSAVHPGLEKREKLSEAKQCAEAMGQWCLAKGRAAPGWLQVKMLQNAVRLVAGCITAFEDLNDRESELASHVIDALAGADGYLETLSNQLRERA